MNDLQEEETPPFENEMRTKFSYKNLREHARCILAMWRHLLIWSFAVFGGIWTAAEASSYFLDISISGRYTYTFTISIALVAGVARTIQIYLNGCPFGFENESQAIRRIAQIQRPLWEFRLAQRLLQDKLRRLDSELEDLIERRVMTRMSQTGSNGRRK